MQSLPSPRDSRAVFIGASSFDALNDLPAVSDNVSALADFFAGGVWGLPTERCLRMVNPPSTRDASQAMREAARDATDTLLVYYAGHGLLDHKGRLHLAVPDSDPQSVYDTAVPYEWVRLAVESSPATRRIVILDCCYSARAMGPQSASMVDLAEADGTYVLAAAAETAVALAPPGETFTAFTGALVGLLTDGVAGAPELLTLDTVFNCLQSSLKQQSRPDPQSLCRNQVGQTPFIRNPAYIPSEDQDSFQAALTMLHQARSLAETLQAVADGVVNGLGFELAAVNLVRPDGDLIVAAVAGSPGAEARMAGRVVSRASWERRLAMGEAWDTLRFSPYAEGQAFDDGDAAQPHAAGPAPRFPGEWDPMDLLVAPMYASNDDLMGVISVDKPRDGHRPSLENRQELEAYAFQASIAISNARLRSNMQRALVRLEREQQALRASEVSFRQAFEYAPSGMAIAEMGGDRHGRLIKTNDALCRLLGRPASVIRRYCFSDLVHPEDIGTLLRTSAEGGRAELRISRRDGSYIWVSLRNSVVADAADGPRFLLTHVEDIEVRKRHELQLAHRASHDSLTGLPNNAEIHAQLTGWLCADPDAPRGADTAWIQHAGRGVHEHIVMPAQEGATNLAVLVCGLDSFKRINDRFGHRVGDAVLQTIAQRLTTSSRNGDIIGRLRSDEYVVLSPGLTTADADSYVQKLRRTITQPIRLDGQTALLDATFGTAWAVCGTPADTTIQIATQHMHATKQARSAIS